MIRGMGGRGVLGVREVGNFVISIILIVCRAKAVMLSRALDNMGKVHAWMGQYEKAIIL